MLWFKHFLIKLRVKMIKKRQDGGRKCVCVYFRISITKTQFQLQIIGLPTAAACDIITERRVNTNEVTERR